MNVCQVGSNPAAALLLVPAAPQCLAGRLLGGTKSVSPQRDALQEAAYNYYTRTISTLARSATLWKAKDEGSPSAGWSTALSGRSSVGGRVWREACDCCRELILARVLRAAVCS